MVFLLVDGWLRARAALASGHFRTSARRHLGKLIDTVAKRRRAVGTLAHRSEPAIDVATRHDTSMCGCVHTFARDAVILWPVCMAH
jgi:hypothetical protein